MSYKAEHTVSPENRIEFVLFADLQTAGSEGQRECRLGPPFNELS